MNNGRDWIGKFGEFAYACIQQPGVSGPIPASFFAAFLSDTVKIP